MVKSSDYLAPLLLVPRVKRYAWGDPAFIANALGLPPSENPPAEAWFGAHPLGPATARLGDDARSLEELIKERPASFLGRDLHERYGRLPYLLKLLAAARPLSIQVHASRRHARRGFALENEAGLPLDAPNRRYKDDNHKPEVLVALTPFHALCGFRPPGEIASSLAAAREVSRLLPRYDGTRRGLRRLVAAYFSMSDQQRRRALGSMLARLAGENERAPFPESDPSHWVLFAHQALSKGGEADPGLFLIYLMRYRRLAPGQGLFVAPGVLHAYLRGAGVELMASSDNVLRAGLTGKHVDPDELMQVSRFDSSPPPVLEAVDDAAGIEGTWALPAEELRLSRLRLFPGIEASLVARGPETLLALTDGARSRVQVEHAWGSLELTGGQACIVPHGARYSLKADGLSTIFRAGVPPRPTRSAEWSWHPEQAHTGTRASPALSSRPSFATSRPPTRSSPRGAPPA